MYSGVHARLYNHSDATVDRNFMSKCANIRHEESTWPLLVCEFAKKWVHGGSLQDVPSTHIAQKKKKKKLLKIAG